MAQEPSQTTKRAAGKPAPKRIKTATTAYAVPAERLSDFVQAITETSLGSREARSGGYRVIVEPLNDAVEHMLHAAVRKKIATPVVLEQRPLGKAATSRGAGRAGIDPQAFEPGAKARALPRGLEIAERNLKAAGGAYDLAQVGQLSSISRQAIHKKVQEGALLAVPGPGNQRRYPAVQFTRGGTLPGLRDALTALGSKNAWYKLNWLVIPDPRIGNRAPAQLLVAGDVAAAVAAARSQGEQGR